MEKLNLEDAYVMELVVNKINSIIDTVEELEERLSGRVDRHWSYHRHIKMTMDGVKELRGKLISESDTKVKESKGGAINESDTKENETDSEK